MSIKTLNISKVTEGYSGENRNGNAYTIYDIEAIGNSQKLRSFDNLPLGENQYEVEPYDKDGETTYTLKPHGFKVPRSYSESSSSSSLAALEMRVTELERKFAGGEAVAPSGGATGYSADDDIPF